MVDRTFTRAWYIILLHVKVVLCISKMQHVHQHTDSPRARAQSSSFIMSLEGDSGQVCTDTIYGIRKKQLKGKQMSILCTVTVTLL